MALPSKASSWNSPLNTTNSQGAAGQAKVSLDMGSFGYDWAFIHAGEPFWAPLVELGPAPARSEFGQATVVVDGQSSVHGGRRTRSGPELALLGHAPFLDRGPSPLSCQTGRRNVTMAIKTATMAARAAVSGSGSNNQQSSDNLSEEGFEARLSAGWRLF